MGAPPDRLDRDPAPIRGRIGSESVRTGPIDHGEYDQVAEAAEGRLEHRQVRRCLKTLTELQRQAVTLAYYGGHTYGQVATLLDTAVPTVKSRIRDGLLKLRDCLEVAR
ncbi:hypothetical protein GCM10009853_031070 [Glycomyces scopariae]